MLLVLVCSFSLSVYVLFSQLARIYIQNALIKFLSLDIHDDEVKVKSNDRKVVEVAQEFDDSVESFYVQVLDKFINVWFSKVSTDQIFIRDIKHELITATRIIANRVTKVDHAALITEKLIPVLYTHIDILDRIDHHIDPAETTKAFIENENPIHPATYNRQAELKYLRTLAKNLMKILVTKNFMDCQVVTELLKEILSCCVLLPLMDILSDPATINQLVILATNTKTHKKKVKSKGKVSLLEKFSKSFSATDKCLDDEENLENFLKSQEELYNFMQYLKNRNEIDIELLKFYLDVEQMNNELENSNVICDPKKLSDLQQKSERLLKLYQDKLYFTYSNDKKVPNDLNEAFEHAKKILQIKWRNEFCRSAEYFRLVYGDRENSSFNTPENSKIPISIEATNQKFSTKLKSAMTMKTETVEGLEAPEIPIFDAFDYSSSHSSYLGPVAVKLRRERGQDLDNFMQTLFHSIDQDADLGEDIVSMQLKNDDRMMKRKPLFLGNVDLFKNLFNITGQSKISQFTTVLQIKSNVDCVMHFLSSILKVHQVILRITKGVFNFFPDSNKIIHKSLEKVLKKSLDQVALAELIKELEVKLFNETYEAPASKEELNERQKLAMTRIVGVNRHLKRLHQHLQNPVLNKHLMYCLVDLLVTEVFPEFDSGTKD